MKGTLLRYNDNIKSLELVQMGCYIKKIETFTYLSKKFEANEISREEYWKGMQSFLSEITLFAQARKKYSTEIEILQSRIIFQHF